MKNGPQSHKTSTTDHHSVAASKHSHQWFEAIRTLITLCMGMKKSHEREKIPTCFSMLWAIYLLLAVAADLQRSHWRATQMCVTVDVCSCIHIYQFLFLYVYALSTLASSALLHSYSISLSLHSFSVSFRYLCVCVFLCYLLLDQSVNVCCFNFSSFEKNVFLFFFVLFISLFAGSLFKLDGFFFSV